MGWPLVASIGASALGSYFGSKNDKGGEIQTKQFDTLTPGQKRLLGANSNAYFGGEDRYTERVRKYGPKKGGSVVEGSNYLDDMNRDIKDRYVAEADDVYRTGAAYDSGLQGYSDYMKNRPGTEGLRDFEHGYGAVDDLINKGTEFDEEYFKTNVQDPMMRKMQEEIMPGIAREYGKGSGFYSSDRMMQDKNMQDEFIESVTGSRAKMAYENKQQNIQNMLEAVGLGQGMREGEGIYNLRRSELDSNLASQNANTGILLDKYGIGMDEANMMSRYGMENKYSADLENQINRMMKLGTGKLFDTAVGTQGAPQNALGPLMGAVGEMGSTYISSKYGS